MASHQGRDKEKESLTAGLALLDDIPPLDMAVHRLIEALSNEEISERDLASIIDECPSLSGKIVGLANSAYFRRAQAIQSLHDAIALVGMRIVKSLAIATALQEPFSNLKCPAFHPGLHWLYGVLTAQAASELSKCTAKDLNLHAEEAYLAGLLHHMGLLALAYLFPSRLNPLLEECDHQYEQIAIRTQQEFGASHLIVGAALLKHWHLPECFVTTTRYHASPDYQGSNWALSRLTGVAHCCAIGILQQNDEKSFSPDILKQLGVSIDKAAKAIEKCQEKLHVYQELSEIISGCKVDFSDQRIVVDAALDLKERLTESVNSLSTIRALTNLDIRSKTGKEALDEALRILMEHQDMQRCSIFINRDGSLINASGLSWEEHFTGEHNNLDKAKATHNFAVGEGIIGMVAKTGKMKHAKDCAKDTTFKAVDKQIEHIPGSLICVPICFQDSILGVLNISHSQANVFTDWHERFLSVFSNMLGQLIMFHHTISERDAEIDQQTKELQKALSLAETLSTHDELTGIHNRRYFISHFSKFIQQCERYDFSVAVLMIDIDNFKSINDTYGHLEGDLVLVKVAKAITQCARDADIVARLGGEEFFLALQHSNCTDVRKVAERILHKIRNLECGDKIKYRISASIGISCSDQITQSSGKSVEKWMQEADSALYQAKRSGKDCLVFYGEQ